MREAKARHAGGQDTLPPDFNMSCWEQGISTKSTAGGWKVRVASPRAYLRGPYIRVPAARTARRGPKGELSGHTAEKRQRDQLGRGPGSASCPRPLGCSAGFRPAPTKAQVKGRLGAHGASRPRTTTHARQVRQVGGRAGSSLAGAPPRRCRAGPGDAAPAAARTCRTCRPRRPHLPARSAHLQAARPGPSPPRPTVRAAPCAQPALSVARRPGAAAVRAISPPPAPRAQWSRRAAHAYA